LDLYWCIVEENLTFKNKLAQFVFGARRHEKEYQFLLATLRPGRRTIGQKHIHLTPIKALFWNAVVNGVVAVPVMVVMMLMISNKKVMKHFACLSLTMRVVGRNATIVMTAAAIGMFATWKS
jgi:hypothetical protein